VQRMIPTIPVMLMEEVHQIFASPNFVRSDQKFHHCGLLTVCEKLPSAIDSK